MLAARITFGSSPSISSESFIRLAVTLQAVFEHTDIFVAGAKQGLDAAGDLNAEFHSKMKWLSCMREQQGGLVRGEQDRRSGNFHPRARRKSKHLPNIIPEGARAGPLYSPRSAKLEVSAMPFLSHVPAPPLSQFVNLLWLYEGYTQPHAKERILPTGEMQIVINLLEDRSCIYDRDDTDRCQTFGGSLLSGAHSRVSGHRHREAGVCHGCVFPAGRRIPVPADAGGRIARHHRIARYAMGPGGASICGINCWKRERIRLVSRFWSERC